MVTSERKKLSMGIGALAAILAFVWLFFCAPFSYAHAQNDKKIVLESSYVTTAVAAREGVYAGFSQGDTVTVTYALIVNEGLLESTWTPTYDDRFALTSFAVGQNWSLFNSYPYEGQGGVIEYRTAAEQIAAFNAARASSGEFSYERLTFQVFASIDEATALSASFITITYTALSDIEAPTVGSPVLTFGLNAGVNAYASPYTQAAASGDELMDIFFKTGEEQGEPVLSGIAGGDLSLRVLAPITATFEDQEIEINDGVFAVESIVYDLLSPVADPQTSVNPYVAEGGAVSFLFYTADPALGGEPILDGGNPALPSVAGVYFVTATFSETEHFDGLVLSAWITLVERATYSFSFRAILGEDHDSEVFLDWNGAKFVLSDESKTSVFSVGSPLPKKDGVCSFRIVKWFKAVEVNNETQYVEVVLFEKAQSVEIDDGAYYLAEMAYDVGAGDVNGDDLVNIDDVLVMKRAFVSPQSSTAIATPAEAWAHIGDENRGGLLFLSARDVNADGRFDSRDVVYTLEAIATGYAFVIKSGVTAEDSFVGGERVLAAQTQTYEGETFDADSVEEIAALISANKVVRLTADVNAEGQDVEIFFSGDIVIDLNGFAFSAHSFLITAGGSFTIRNGSIAYDSVTIQSGTGIYLKGIANIDDINGEITTLSE